MKPSILLRVSGFLSSAFIGVPGKHMDINRRWCPWWITDRDHQGKSEDMLRAEKAKDHME